MDREIERICDKGKKLKKTRRNSKGRRGSGEASAIHIEERKRKRRNRIFHSGPVLRARLHHLLASSFPCCLEQPCFNYIICGCLTSPLLHLSLKAGAYDATHNGPNLLWGLNGRNLQIPHGDYVLCHPSQQRRNIGHGCVRVGECLPLLEGVKGISHL